MAERYKLLGIIILPGLQWSKYLLSSKNGKDKIVYEHELQDLIARHKVSNCELHIREKKAYDDYDIRPEIITHPINLLDNYFVKIPWSDWDANDNGCIERYATKLKRLWSDA